MAPRVSTWIALAVGSDGPAVAMACDVDWAGVEKARRRSKQTVVVISDSVVSVQGDVELRVQ